MTKYIAYLEIFDPESGETTFAHKEHDALSNAIAAMVDMRETVENYGGVVLHSETSSENYFIRAANRR